MGIRLNFRTATDDLHSPRKRKAPHYTKPSQLRNMCSGDPDRYTCILTCSQRFRTYRNIDLTEALGCAKGAIPKPSMFTVRILVLFVFEWLLCNVCDGFLRPNVIMGCTGSRTPNSRRKFTLGSNKEGATISQYTGGEEVTLSFRPSGVQVRAFDT